MTDHNDPASLLTPQFRSEELEVLFVDDETQALKYLPKALKHVCPVKTAASVREAVGILDESDKVAVIITDQMMPEERGTALLAHARENYPHIVRILTTAYADLDSAIESINSGEIFRFIEKPWDLVMLEGIVREALERYKDQLRPEAFANIDSETIFLNVIKRLQQDCDGWRLYAMHSLDRLADYEAGIEALVNRYNSSLLHYLPAQRAQGLIERIDDYIDSRYLNPRVLSEVKEAVSGGFRNYKHH